MDEPRQVALVVALLLFALGAALRILCGGPRPKVRGYGEPWSGALTALLMLGAFGISIAMLWSEWSEFRRVTVAVVVLVVALAAASAEWTRGWLRGVGFLSVLVVAVLVAVAGHDVLAGAKSSYLEVSGAGVPELLPE